VKIFPVEVLIEIRAGAASALSIARRPNIIVGLQLPVSRITLNYAWPHAFPGGAPIYRRRAHFARQKTCAMITMSNLCRRIHGRRRELPGVSTLSALIPWETLVATEATLTADVETFPSRF